MRVIDKLAALPPEGAPHFSLEFFPPKTEAGLQNLYVRMQRMTSMRPLFVDITLGAGGSTSELSLAIAAHAQKYLGTEAMLHVTCSGVTRDQILALLEAARSAGIQNVLALRGDPVKGAALWTPTKGGLGSALELVQLIRSTHGDYFGIAVAGFPEGHPSSAASHEEQMVALAAKVQAGADLVLTQFFYESGAFLSFLASCRSAGIKCPVIPGMMPIQSYAAFSRMTAVCRTRVPPTDVEAFRGNDEEAKAYGVALCVHMCRELMRAGVVCLHFYTLNLERSVLAILSALGVGERAAARREVPWRGAREGSAGSEAVRPIHWANRHRAYIDRTHEWDEFPNGRWGDNRSPAFGELSDLHFLPSGGERSREDRLAMWGETLRSHADVYAVFQRYVEGRIPMLPWCEEPLQVETSTIARQLSALNRAGFLTINSQPAVNGVPSDHTILGWGGPGGRVYQKAYVEFFASPASLELLMRLVARRTSTSLHAINVNGDYRGNCPRSVTALTWGVFPDKEVQQPTVFDPASFEVWSQESFSLWVKAWAALYDDETDTSGLLYEIHDTYYLVALIENDYVESDIFAIFDEMVAEQTALANSAARNKTPL